MAAMSREEFLNGIPDFLDRLYQSLRGKEITFADIGKGHGTIRWKYGFDLQLTIKEWGTLHRVVKKEITSLLDEYELHRMALNEVHNMLSTHIQEGIEHSISEYNKLQQNEAEAQLMDIEKALEQPESIPLNHNLRATSHDLKGIMTNIQVGLRLLNDEDLSPNAEDLIDQMSTSADSLEQLLNDLLDLFRLETNSEEVNLSEFNVAEIIRKLCESMQPTAKKEQLQLKCESPTSLHVRSDKKKVKRVAQNLLQNALKHTEEGHVEIKCEQLSEDNWMLEVRDTGPGLDATYAKSFTSDTESSNKQQVSADTTEYNSSSEAENHGEGIGLLIVGHLCRLLDATIEVNTQSGEGTTFKIVMPELEQ